MALHLSVDRKGADWVTKPRGAIKKGKLTFTTKFLWLIVHHCLFPTAGDNIVTLDHTVLMAAMIAEFEVDFFGFYKRSCTRGLLRSQLVTLFRA